MVGIDNGLQGDDVTGNGVNLSLGMRSGNLGLELGLLGTSYRLNGPEGDVQSQGFELEGGSADAKLYLPMGRVVEPYLLGGVGLYKIDRDSEAGDLRPVVDLGGGVDLRVDRNIAIGARYTYHGFWFDQQADEAKAPEGTWGTMGTLTFYF